MDEILNARLATLKADRGKLRFVIDGAIDGAASEAHPDSNLIRLVTRWLDDILIRPAES